MNVAVSEVSYNELYSILLNSVAPRPIAWVSTVNAAGQANLAPFSFFNVVCVDPPLLAFAPGMRRKQRDATHSGGASHFEIKDTLRNVRETKEFVVNIITYDLREAMNVTSGEYDESINEFELAKLTPQPSRIVRPPRVGESPVSFECTLHQILDFSTAPTSGSLVHRSDRDDPHRRCAYQGRQTGSQLARSHRTNGRNAVYEDDAAI